MEVVKENVEVAEEDFVFTWQHFCLLILFVTICTMISFFFLKVCL